MDNQNPSSLNIGVATAARGDAPKGRRKRTNATQRTNAGKTAKAHQYYDAIKRGSSFAEIAASEKLSKRRILQVIDLAFLAPDIVRSVVQGDQPIGLTAKWLGQNSLPADWGAQRRIIAARWQGSAQA